MNFMNLIISHHLFMIDNNFQDKLGDANLWLWSAQWWVETAYQRRRPWHNFWEGFTARLPNGSRLLGIVTGGHLGELKPISQAQNGHNLGGKPREWRGKGHNPRRISREWRDMKRKNQEETKLRNCDLCDCRQATLKGPTVAWAR